MATPPRSAGLLVSSPVSSPSPLQLGSSVDLRRSSSASSLRSAATSPSSSRRSSVTTTASTSSASTWSVASSVACCSASSPTPAWVVSTVCSSRWGPCHQPGHRHRVGHRHSGIVTFGLAKLLDNVMGLRVSGDEELTGLDQTQHAETAYVDCCSGAVNHDDVPPTFDEDDSAAAGVVADRSLVGTALAARSPQN